MRFGLSLFRASSSPRRPVLCIINKPLGGMMQRKREKVTPKPFGGTLIGSGRPEPWLSWSPAEVVR